MRFNALLATLLIVAASITLTAAEAQPPAQSQPLDPAKPVDAVQIIHLLTADTAMTRRNADAFNAALRTLAELAHKAENAPTVPAEALAPKPEPTPAK